MVWEGAIKHQHGCSVMYGKSLKTEMHECCAELWERFTHGPWPIFLALFVEMPSFPFFFFFWWHREKRFLVLELEKPGFDCKPSYSTAPWPWEGGIFSLSSRFFNCKTGGKHFILLGGCRNWRKSLSGVLGALSSVCAQNWGSLRSRFRSDSSVPLL